MKPRLARLFALVVSISACSGPKVQRVLPQLVINETALEFGTVPVLQQKTVTIDVQNEGRAPLNLAHVLILDYVHGQPGNGQAQAFDTKGAVPTQISAGEKQQLTLVFTPLDEAEYRATLHIDSDDPNTPSLELDLHGTGSTKAVIKVEATGHPGQQSLDFGRVGEGQTALASIDIDSLGTADLIVEGLTLSGDSSVGFASSSRTPTTVPKGTTLPLMLKFSPPEGAPTNISATLTIQSTDPAHQTVTVPITGKVNRAPIAQVPDPGPLAPGQTVTLDGSGSYDPDGDNPIAFTDALGSPGWLLVRAPINSVAQLSPADGPKPSITFDLPGTYEVRLTVTDATGLETLHPADLTLLAKPAQALAVELVWDNSDTDLDLHFVPDGQTLGGPYDCWANNKKPDYSSLGATDSPILDRDALDHFGPEEMTWDQPAAGVYDVYVHFYSTHGSSTPQSNATVRIYEFGEVTAEFSRVLTQGGQTWLAAKVNWPSGEVDKVDTLQ